MKSEDWVGIGTDLPVTVTLPIDRSTRLGEFNADTRMRPDFEITSGCERVIIGDVTDHWGNYRHEVCMRIGVES